MTYYEETLARIHHEAFGDYADLAAPGILARLGGSRHVLELGAGSGALTRHLVAAGHRVVATDASPAMVRLASKEIPEANPRVLTLPGDPIPPSDAVVALGHVFSYLGSEREIEDSLIAVARSCHTLICDILDLSYGTARPFPVDYYHEDSNWKLWTTNRLVGTDRVVREMRIEANGVLTEETHVNVLMNVPELVTRLASRGLQVDLDSSFGEEALPDGFYVLQTRREGDQG